MSTEYKLHEDKFTEFHALEHSSKVDLIIYRGREELTLVDLENTQLRTLIIRLIEVLSYISEDGMEVLKRFNVEYGQNE